MISSGRVATAFASRPSCLVRTSEMNDWTSDGQGKSQKLCSSNTRFQNRPLQRETSVLRPRSSATGDGFLIIYIISICPVLLPLLHPLPAADLSAGSNGDFLYCIELAGHIK